MKKHVVIALLLFMAMAVSMLGGCGDKNPPADAKTPSAEEPAESSTSDIYKQGATELPRNEVDGEPDFFLREDEEGNPVVIPNTDAGGEVLDGTAEDHMMVDDNGENAE